MNPHTLIFYFPLRTLPLLTLLILQSITHITTCGFTSITTQGNQKSSQTPPVLLFSLDFGATPHFSPSQTQEKDLLVGPWLFSPSVKLLFKAFMVTTAYADDQNRLLIGFMPPNLPHLLQLPKAHFSLSACLFSSSEEVTCVQIKRMVFGLR